MKNSKQRTRMRGFDIARLIAFNTFPDIRHIYAIHHEHFVEIRNITTGEVMTSFCHDIDNCTKLARCVNKMLKETEKYINESKI